MLEAIKGGDNVFPTAFCGSVEDIKTAKVVLGDYPGDMLIVTPYGEMVAVEAGGRYYNVDTDNTITQEDVGLKFNL